MNVISIYTHNSQQILIVCITIKSLLLLRVFLCRLVLVLKYVPIELRNNLRYQQEGDMCLLFRFEQGREEAAHTLDNQAFQAIFLRSIKYYTKLINIYLFGN
jgi:hypothetical protein